MKYYGFGGNYFIYSISIILFQHRYLGKTSNKYLKKPLDTCTEELLLHEYK